MAAFEIFKSSKSSSSQYQLKNPPQDGVSSLCFSSKERSDALLATSWDGSVTLYDTKLDSVRWKQSLEEEVPVLCCEFAGKDDTVGFSGSIDGKVHVHNFEISGSKPNSTRILSNGHENGVSCVGYSEELNIACTGGWDKKLCTWDIRSNESRTAIAELPGKAFSLSISTCRVVVLCADRNILIYDLRNLSKPEQVRQSSLQQQMRTVCCSPSNLDAYAIGTVDGRVAIEYFDDQVHSKKKFAFKCHRQKEDMSSNSNSNSSSNEAIKKKEKTTVAYPVNAIAFHPKFGTFATGGGDGMVVTWDAINRKRITEYSKYPTSIAALSFNHDGTRLAIASSYTYERGELKDKPTDSIYVRVIKNEEVQPKVKKIN